MGSEKLFSYSGISTFIQRQLLAVEKLGNRLPHPTMLFIYLCGIALLLSAVMAGLGVSAEHPITSETVRAKNLLSGEGLRQILATAVTNFTAFAPVGTVLVAVMGIGVAEHSGLLRVLLNRTILNAPRRLMTFLVVFAGVLSSLASDTGYVVLVPLAGMLFLAAGRHPIAGIAAAFAGVSGGYSANLLVGPLDAVLAGLSTEAAGLVDSSYEVTVAANYYFIFVSTFLISVVGTFVTEYWVSPLLGEYDPAMASQDVKELESVTFAGDTAKEDRALNAVLVFTLVFVGLLLVCLVPDQGILRDPETSSVLRSPFISGIVVVISIYAALAGWMFGRLNGEFANASDFVLGMERAMVTMASYIVLMFFAAQFVNWFGWSQLGTITAIKGAEVLQALNPNAAVLLVLLVLLCACINLLIGSASAKWALLAPIFVPMLLLSGISPEATQVAYRVGDSATNIITPLMPYFGVVVAFVQKYDRNAGVGTMLATMLPYSLMFLAAWSLLLGLWILFGLPLGPGAPIFVG